MSRTFQHPILVEAHDTLSPQHQKQRLKDSVTLIPMKFEREYSPLAVISFVAPNFAAIFFVLLIYTPLFLFRLFRRLVFNTPNPPRASTPHPPQPQVTLTVQEPKHQGPVRDTVVLIHGYPDSPVLWNATVDQLTSLGYCCLLIGLPGCMGDPVENLVPMATIVDQTYALIADATDKASPRNAQNEDDKRVTIIGHDFGAAFAIYLREKYPHLVRRLVLLDVGEFPFLLHPGKPSLSFVLVSSSYQTLYAMCYLIGGALGTFLLKRFHALHFWQSRPLRELRSDMACLYGAGLLEYADMLNQIIQSLKQKPSEPGSTSDGGDGGNQESSTTTTPPVGEQAVFPTLYIYGRRKLIMFHEDEFLDRVRATPGGAVEEWDCGHWVQLEKEAECLTTLPTWLERSHEAVQDSS